MVSPASQRVLRARWYSGTPPQSRSFRLRGSHPLRPAFPGAFIYKSSLVTVSGICRACVGPTTPCVQRRQPVTYTEFGLFPVRSPLLRELFLFFRVLRCFSSPTCLPVLSHEVPAHHGGGLPHSEISGSACQRLPGAFRSVATSFVGPGCQGIHLLPLFACVTSSLSIPPLLTVPEGPLHRIGQPASWPSSTFLAHMWSSVTLDRCL